MKSKGAYRKVTISRLAARLKTEHSLHDLVNELETVLPPPYPVQITRARLKNDWAYTLLMGKGANKHFEIRIDESLSWPAVVMVLAHEWAHCLVYHADPPHGVVLGAALALTVQVAHGIYPDYARSKR